MIRRTTISFSRLKKLEQAQRRFACLEMASDDDLMVVIFRYDTPELRAAQALERAGDAAGFEKMLLDVVERDAERRKGRAH